LLGGDKKFIADAADNHVSAIAAQGFFQPFVSPKPMIDAMTNDDSILDRPEQVGGILADVECQGGSSAAIDPILHGGRPAFTADEEVYSGLKVVLNVGKKWG
jgi:hypothetical protein